MVNRCRTMRWKLVITSQNIKTVFPLQIIGTLRNEDGSANDDGSEKSHFVFALYFFVRVIRVLFFGFKLCK